MVESGLLALLSRYGERHAIGSYSLRLMTWRDLDIAGRLTEETRAAILAVKTACWRHPQYRKGFTSADVYAAVLDRGVRDLDAFWADLRTTKGISGDA